MSDLTEFLLVRGAEDEAIAHETIDEIERGRWVPGEKPSTTDLGPLWCDPDGMGVNVAATPGRVLAECEAKRRIVQSGDPAPGYMGEPVDAEWERGWREQLEYTLRWLALPYADHPDYREEWRP